MKQFDTRGGRWYILSFLFLVMPRKQEAESQEEPPRWNKGGEDEAGFIDPDFPPSNESVGPEETGSKEWVQAIYLKGYDEKPVLFEDMEPANVCQGY